MYEQFDETSARLIWFGTLPMGRSRGGVLSGGNAGAKMVAALDSRGFP